MGAQPLQHELKKKRPFESPEQEANLNLLRTHDQFLNRFLRLFRPYGLTPTQYNVLRILRGEGKPLPCLEIAARMIQVVPAMTGLVDQAFFADLLGRDFLRNVACAKGRFRSFLLACLNHFLSDERDRAQAAKRGRGQVPISLDADLDISLTPKSNPTRGERIQQALQFMNLALPLPETDRAELLRWVAQEMGLRDDLVRRFVKGQEEMEAEQQAAAAQQQMMAVKPQPFANSPQGLSIG